MRMEELLDIDEELEGGWVSVTFEVGGVVTREGFDALVAGVVTQGCGPDWGGDFAGDEDATQYLLEAMFKGRTVRVFDDECADGFNDILAACRGANACVKISVEGKCDYDATIEMWRPGWRSTESVADLNEGPAVSLERLRKAMGSGETVADLILKLEKIEADVEPLAVEGHKVVREGESYKLVEA